MGEGHIAKMSRQMKGHLCEPHVEGKVKLEKGMVFESIHHYRSILKDFAIDKGFELFMIMNERRR